MKLNCVNASYLGLTIKTIAEINFVISVEKIRVKATLKLWFWKNNHSITKMGKIESQVKIIRLKTEKDNLKLSKKFVLKMQISRMKYLLEETTV